MKFNSKYLPPFLSLSSAIALLSIAYFLELFLNLIPCDLCLQQRGVHFLIILASLICIVSINFKKINKLLDFLVIILWFTSSVFAFYHFGIEKKFWSGFSSCTSKINFNEDTLNNILSTDTLRCDNPQFEILNISLAGWNGLVSLILFTIYISLLYLFKKRKQ